jgi:hypothetical protein
VIRHSQNQPLVKRHRPNKTNAMQRKRNEDNRLLIPSVKAGPPVCPDTEKISQYSGIQKSETTNAVINMDLIMIIFLLSEWFKNLIEKVMNIINSITLRISKRLSAKLIDFIADNNVNIKKPISKIWSAPMCITDFDSVPFLTR